MKNSLFRYGLLLYLVISSVIAHLTALTILIVAPEKAHYVAKKALDYVQHQLAISNSITSTSNPEAFHNILPPYQPAAAGKTPANTIIVNGKSFRSLKGAAAILKDGDEMRIGPGIYHDAIILRANNVTIIGEGSVVFEKASVQGKGAFLVQGDWTRIYNIECRYIKVRDKNGACVRHEGQNLLLDNVYFHDSEEGLLTSRNPGLVVIQNSRFENLGAVAGQAHGIYVDGGELVIKNSIFIRAKEQGMEIKSRAKKTYISGSVIASLDSQDSRLLDIPSGGELTVINSLLSQGHQSVNQDAIGYGLEGIIYTSNTIKIEDNIILLERDGPNQLIHQKDGTPSPTIRNNLIISSQPPPMAEQNTVFKSRNEAGIAPYPFLPSLK